MARLWVVDPGTKTAFSLWSLVSGELIHVGKIKLPTKSDENVSVQAFDLASKILKEHSIPGDEIIVEDGYVRKNPHGVLHTQNVRAAWECAARACEVVVRPRLNPMTWQKRIGTPRYAKSVEVKKYVRLYVESFSKGLADECTQDQIDSIAMGLYLRAHGGH